MAGIQQTDVANDCLDLLNLEPIGSIEDKDIKSRRMKRTYERAVRVVSRIQNFNGATERVQLSSSTRTLFGGVFKYQHQLPGDYVKVQKVEVSGADVQWRIEGRKLIAEFSELDVIYTKNITDPNKMDSLMLEAVAHWMAYILAIPLTKDKALKKEVREAMVFILGLARTVDSQESSARKITGFNSFRKIRQGVNPRALNLDTSGITGDY